MSQTARPDGTTISGQHHQQGVRPTTLSAWVGWIAFAGYMMLLLGIFHLIAGLVALFQEEYFLVGPGGLAVNLDYTTWAWAHMIGGLVIAAAGVGLFTGRMWARTVAVLLALASAIANIGFLAAYPIWSSIMIAVDILVIWAVTVHGSELKQ